MEASPQNKEYIRKTLQSFKSAGVDISKLVGMKIDPGQAEFELTIKEKSITIDIDFNTGDVYYKDFTTKNLLGNLSNTSALTSSIKDQLVKDKEVAPNAKDQEDKVKQLKEMVKKMIKKHLDEESSTGTGASMSAGAGEQYATPNAFAPKSKKKDLLNRAGRYLVKQGFKPVSNKTRFNAKSFDIEKW